MPFGVAETFSSSCKMFRPQENSILYEMRVFLITGFALDKRAFSPLNLPSDPYRLVDLIPVQKGESLAQYARRLGKELGVKAGDVVGGVSLGGMLALEIAAATPGIQGVILIASCVHPKFIRRRFANLAFLAPYVPEWLIRRIFTLIPTVLKFQKMLSPSGQALLADIMGKFPPALLKAFPTLIMSWPGRRPPENFRQLHAEGDWMIKPDGPKENLVTLPGKNHLITVSHPKETREFILDAVQTFLIPAPGG